MLLKVGQRHEPYCFVLYGNSLLYHIFIVSPEYTRIRELKKNKTGHSTSTLIVPRINSSLE